MTDQTFDLEITGMAHGGRALGRYQGRTVFVPYAIPGERIKARVVGEKGRVWFAEGLTLHAASADRVFPRCAHYGPGRCGHCLWQHIAYPAQLLLKQDVLADQLARIGGFDEADVRPVIASPQEWGYAHHMTFTVLENGVLAMPSSDGRPPYPISECHTLHPDLLALKDAFDLNVPGLKQVKLQLGSDGAHMVVLSIAGDEAPELELNLPTSVNLLLEDNEPVNLIGETHTRYTVRGRTFRVTAGSSSRANVSQFDNLIAAVLTALHLSGSEAALDLYAGAGLFGAFMAEQARRVTLVESYPPAATDADDNLADRDNVDIIEGAVEDVLDALDDDYDTALVDPPGEGLSTDAVDRLGDLELRRVVYVSSDPATLARDGKRLVGHGYRLVYVQPLDLAPQTHFIDSVAVFER